MKSVGFALLACIVSFSGLLAMEREEFPKSVVQQNLHIRNDSSEEVEVVYTGRAELKSGTLLPWGQILKIIYSERPEVIMFALNPGQEKIIPYVLGVTGINLYFKETREFLNPFTEMQDLRHKLEVNKFKNDLRLVIIDETAPDRDQLVLEVVGTDKA